MSGKRNFSLTFNAPASTMAFMSLFLTVHSSCRLQYAQGLTKVSSVECHQLLSLLEKNIIE